MKTNFQIKLEGSLMDPEGEMFYGTYMPTFSI